MKVLEGLGATPDEVLDALVERLLPDAAIGEERSAARVRLIMAFGGDPATDDASILVEGLIRRLGPELEGMGDLDSLVDAAIAQIDPDRTINSVADLLEQVDSWAEAIPANVLVIGSAGADAVSALGDLDASDFDSIVATLEQLRISAEVIVVGLDGVTGLDDIVLPGVTWIVDEQRRAITFTGTSRSPSATGEVSLNAIWGQRTTPVLVAGLVLPEWTLGDAGFSGDFGDTELPNVGILLSDTEILYERTELPQTVNSLLSATSPPSDGRLLLDKGINLFSTIDVADLPTIAMDVIGGGSNNANIAVHASIGSDFGATTGSATPDTAMLTLSLDGVDPPSFPDWLSANTDESWAVTLETGGQRDVTVGLMGTVDADLDGGPRSFMVQLDAESDSTDSSATLVGHLVDPWRAPFGVDWLTIDDAVMTVALSSTNRSASFSAEVFIADREANLSFDIDNTTSDTSVVMSASIEVITAADVVGFLANTTGTRAPATIPDISLTDVLVEVAAGTRPTFAFGGQANIVNQNADVLLSLETPPGATESSIVLGVGLDEWRLGDALPLTNDTVVGDIEFPASALVLSTLDGSIDPAELSAPAERFFDQTRPGQEVRLSPGLSILSSFDISGSVIEEPLAAIGYDSTSLPVGGTLPLAMLGGSSSSPATGGLRDLDLAIELPDIRPANAPAWFQNASMSLIVTGQPSLGLTGNMTVLIDGQQLTFTIGAEFARTTLGVELALWGAVEAGEPWVAPFGVDWLTVNSLAIQLSVSPPGTIGLGFAGSVIIGDEDIDAAIAIELTGGIPTNFALEASSVAGVSSGDLLRLQARMGAPQGGGSQLDFSAFPELSIRDIEIRFAPRAVERLGIEAGFVLAGDVYVGVGGNAPSLFASLDFRLTEDGLFATGFLEAFDLGPIEWSDITLDLEISRNDQRFMFAGMVDLFGLQIEADVNLSTRSIFFAGRQALDELRNTVEFFETLVRDPGEAIGQLQYLFEAAGLGAPQWLDDLAAAVSSVSTIGQDVSVAVINTILQGGSIPLLSFPPGGADQVCGLLTPFERDRRCFTTLASITVSGLPANGVAPECPITSPIASGGRCYLFVPDGGLECTFGHFINSDDNRCYIIGPNFIDKNGTPNGGLRARRDDGTPNGGVPVGCPLLTPFPHGGRCWTIAPGNLIPDVPAGGEPMMCSILAPVAEGGRCWTVSPTQAANGLGVSGICDIWPQIACTVDELLQQDVASLILGGIVDRFNNW